MLYPREDGYIKLKIDAVNRANDLANRIYAQMVPFFKPFIGKKVINNDLYLTKAIKEKLPPIVGDGIRGNGLSHHILYYPSQYNIGWKIQVTVWDKDNNHVDADAYVYIGKLEGGILKEIMPSEQQQGRTTNYDFTTVMKLREAAKEAHKAFDDAYSACFPFQDDSLRY